MEETTMFIGLDVHKATIAVAIAEGGRREAARYFGEIENTPTALSKLAKKYKRANARLSFCYEAGPCGYGVHRHLVGLGHECLVVAPSLIPKRAGDRVKTDRRDAVALAQLHRAGAPFGSRTRRMRPCVTWSGHAWSRCAVSAGHDSNCSVFCCDTVSSIPARPGRGRIGIG